MNKGFISLFARFGVDMNADRVTMGDGKVIKDHNGIMTVSEYRKLRGVPVFGRPSLLSRWLIWIVKRFRA
jgi:hypothetical protein